nr:MAG TPA: hypothetical protein [Bacteriophage sp.]
MVVTLPTQLFINNLQLIYKHYSEILSFNFTCSIYGCLLPNQCKALTGFGYN